MEITIKLGDGYTAFINGLTKAPNAMSDAVDEGLAIGTTQAAAYLKQAIHKGTEGIQTRTGNLARAIKNYNIPSEQHTYYLGVGEDRTVALYAWLLGSETKTIEPKQGKYLTIPMGSNVSPSGVPKFNSPRQVPQGFFFKKNGKLFFGVQEGDKVNTLFVLKESVTITGSGALDRTLEKYEPRIMEIIKKKIHQAFNKLGLN